MKQSEFSLRASGSITIVIICFSNHVKVCVSENKNKCLTWGNELVMKHWTTAWCDNKQKPVKLNWLLNFTSTQTSEKSLSKQNQSSMTYPKKEKKRKERESAQPSFPGSTEEQYTVFTQAPLLSHVNVSVCLFISRRSGSEAQQRISALPSMLYTFSILIQLHENMTSALMFTSPETSENHYHVKCFTVSKNIL